MVLIGYGAVVAGAVAETVVAMVPAECLVELESVRWDFAVVVGSLAQTQPLGPGSPIPSLAKRRSCYRR